jgi:O-methyltransferase involved in polyketide biosynthesis
MSTEFVILGVGMDTFAFKQPEMMKHLEVFDVDQTATQEFKLHLTCQI